MFNNKCMFSSCKCVFYCCIVLIESNPDKENVYLIISFPFVSTQSAVGWRGGDRMEVGHFMSTHSHHSEAQSFGLPESLDIYNSNIVGHGHGTIDKDFGYAVPHTLAILLKGAFARPDI